MKAFFTAVLAVVCAVVLIYGQIHWNDKIHSASGGMNIAKAQDSVVHKQDYSPLLAYAANWPQEAKEAFKQKLEEKKIYRIMMVGSNAIGSEPGSLSDIVSKKMTETYGADHLQVRVHAYNTTSAKFIMEEKYLKLAEEGADLVLFEPFTLNDNGVVETGSSLKNITTFMNAFKEKNPKAVFILQPPHPINATYYPKQVEQLKAFAKENGIAYIDHWKAWPVSADLKDYLLADQSGPNEKGIKIWSDYILNYLITQ